MRWDLADIPKKLLVVGGGIIGLEMACVYDALGSEVTVVELLDQLMPVPMPILFDPCSSVWPNAMPAFISR